MRATSERAPLGRRLDGGGWGLLFIWVGIALATDIRWGVALVGVGLIVLGVQAARKLTGFAVDRFSLTIGGLFVVGGILESVNASLALVPLLCIGVGIVLLVSALAGRRRPSGRDVDTGASATHGPA